MSDTSEIISYENARLEIEGPLATFWFDDRDKFRVRNLRQ